MENTFEKEMLAQNSASQGEPRQEDQDNDLEQTSFEEEDDDFVEGAEDEDQALDTTEEM